MAAAVLRRAARAILAAALLCGSPAFEGLAPAVLSAQTRDAGHPRAATDLTILQLNDVYSTVPVDGRGGLARVATLDRELAAAGRATLMLLAGDFLSSSVASTVFKGEQMIAALNAAGLDLATLGNHEFDFGVDILLQRMREAKFGWVVSNVIDAETGAPIGGADPYVIRTFGAFRVGIIGLCLTSEGVTRDKLNRIRLLDPLEMAAKYIAVLKEARVDSIVALTHLSFADDRILAARFPEIDVIVGGHEHDAIAAFEGRTLISKADSDAKSVARIDIGRRPGGPLERFYELVPITASIAEEPVTAGVVASYESRLGAELEKVVARTAVPLDGVAASLRASETNLGNLVADAAREAVGAELAIVNAGGIRGDRVHQAGAITRRALVEIHPFGNTVTKVAVPGRVIRQALEYGTSRLPIAAGFFPQVSGLRFRVDPRAPPGERVREITVQGAPLDPAKTYTLAVTDYMLNGGDGYLMFAGAQVLIDVELGPTLLTAMEQQVENREIAPVVEGRITIDR